jgi:RNA polymerase sigma factor (sigma-70 family)
VDYSSTEHDAIIRPAIWRLLPSLPPYLTDEDAMQEARVGVWKALPKWEPSQGPLVGFIRRVATMRLIDFIRVTNGKHGQRRQRTWGERILSLDWLSDTDEREFYDAHADPQADDPEEVAVRHVDAALAMTAFRSLSEQQMRAALLRADGLSQYEIAERIGVTQSAVSELLRRGKERVLREMAA